MARNFLFNPRTYQGEAHDPQTREIMLKTIARFEHKGLREMKLDDRNNRYADYFVKAQRDLGAFAHMLTPKGYGQNPETAMFDLLRITEYNEMLSFYNLSTRYIFQVTLLGLGPIWMGQNEAVKRQAARLLSEGAVFGFGCSEKEHGADLYSNEMCITERGDGTYRTDGQKYYIGNCDRGYISTFARFRENGEWGDWAWVLADSGHPHYNNRKHITASYLHTAYVGEYALVDYPTDDQNLISRGDQAWADALSTVNIGKFQVGVSPIGVATHAFYECLHHSHNRWLYGRRVTDMPHVRKMFVEAYLRTVGMRLFAYRAVDYFKQCSKDDRRYLLFNPVNKMKSAMEGLSAVNQLFDAVTARGFETETFMEQATRDIQSSPRLEGTAHVNLSLIIKFIDGYFFNPKDYSFLPPQGPSDDSCVFNQEAGSMRSITFPDYRTVLDGCDLPNAKAFARQANLLRKFFAECAPADRMKDMDYMFNLGQMFTMIPYAQLILESSRINLIDDDILDQMFGLFVADMARYCVAQIFSHENTGAQEGILRAILDVKPVHDNERYDRVWRDTIEPLSDAYVMNEY